MRPRTFLGAAALALGGCAVSATSSATRIDDAAVPHALLESEAPNVVAEPGGRDVTICFFDDDRLVMSDRRLADDSTLIDVARSLAALTDAEAGRGWQTAISGADEVRRISLSGGTATVDFADDASQSLTRDPLATVAQLVCTITGQPGVGLVRFSVGRTPIEVPRADGSLTDAAVSRDDYGPLLRSPG